MEALPSTLHCEATYSTKDICSKRFVGRLIKEIGSLKVKVFVKNRCSLFFLMNHQ